MGCGITAEDDGSSTRGAASDGRTVGAVVTFGGGAVETMGPAFVAGQSRPGRFNTSPTRTMMTAAVKVARTACAMNWPPIVFPPRALVRLVRDGKIVRMLGRGGF